MVMHAHVSPRRLLHLAPCIRTSCPPCAIVPTSSTCILLYKRDRPPVLVALGFLFKLSEANRAAERAGTLLPERRALYDQSRRGWSIWALRMACSLFESHRPCPCFAAPQFSEAWLLFPASSLSDPRTHARPRPVMRSHHHPRTRSRIHASAHMHTPTTRYTHTHTQLHTHTYAQA